MRLKILAIIFSLFSVTAYAQNHTLNYPISTVDGVTGANKLTTYTTNGAMRWQLGSNSDPEDIITTTTTADAASGSNNLPVVSSAGMAAGAGNYLIATSPAGVVVAGAIVSGNYVKSLGATNLYVNKNLAALVPAGSLITVYNDTGSAFVINDADDIGNVFNIISINRSTGVVSLTDSMNLPSMNVTSGPNNFYGTNTFSGSVNSNAGFYATKKQSTFTYNSVFTDPQPGVNRDVKFGGQGIAWGGGAYGDTLQLTGLMTNSLSNGLTATGTTQATALVLTSVVNIFSTVAAGTGAELPVAPATGSYRINIINQGANALLVYPATGAQINAAGANVAISVPVGTSTITYTSSGATQWYQ